MIEPVLSLLMDDVTRSMISIVQHIWEEISVFFFSSTGDELWRAWDDDVMRRLFFLLLSLVYKVILTTKIHCEWEQKRIWNKWKENDRKLYNFFSSSYIHIHDRRRWAQLVVDIYSRERTAYTHEVINNNNATQSTRWRGSGTVDAVDTQPDFKSWPQKKKTTTKNDIQSKVEAQHSC